LDKIHLIEVIETQTARLSPEGRELWEQLEFLRESIPNPEDESRMAREYEIVEQIFELPAPEQFAISRLAELVDGLRKSEKAEDQGKPGYEHRVRGVLNAAWIKDRQEGLSIDPNMTLDRALARLQEPG
jgi:hypothetical protein